MMDLFPILRLCLWSARGTWLWLLLSWCHIVWLCWRWWLNHNSCECRCWCWWSNWCCWWTTGVIFSNKNSLQGRFWWRLCKMNMSCHFGWFEHWCASVCGGCFKSTYRATPYNFRRWPFQQCHIKIYAANYFHNHILPNYVCFAARHWKRWKMKLS